MEFVLEIKISSKNPYVHQYENRCTKPPQLQLTNDMNRERLAQVRVMQKNLVFVVGLSAKIAEEAVLRRNEYFGKFGKILKVAVNQSTSYAGTQVSKIFLNFYFEISNTKKICRT